LNANLVIRFQSAISKASKPHHLRLIKKAAVNLSQREQLSVVDSFISARQRVTGGAA
jgi:hypothetical protein